MFTAEVLASLSFACYIGAVVLNQCFDRIYKRCKRCGRVHWRLLNIRCTEAGSASLPSSADSAPSEGLRTAEGPEFPVVGSAAWRRPLITHMENRSAILRNLSSSMQADFDRMDGPSQAPVDHTATDENRSGASEQVTDVRDTSIHAAPARNDPESNAAGADKPVTFLLRLLGLFIWHTSIAPPNIVYNLYAFEDESGFRAAELRIAQRRATSDRPATTKDHAEMPISAAATDPRSSTHQPIGTVLKRHVQSCCYVLYKAIRAALKQTATLIVRSCMAFCTLEWYVFAWIEWKVMRLNPPKLLMMGFGFLNFITAVSCYLIFFDSTGTAAPRWAYIFG